MTLLVNAMPKTLTLPDDLYAGLEEMSQDHGMRPEDYALEILRSEISSLNVTSSAEAPGDLYALVRGLRLGKSVLSKQKAQQIDVQINATLENQHPHFPTVEAAMSWSRGYSWVKDASD